MQTACKMWTHPCILTNLSSSEAHLLLSRVKATNIGDKVVWVNGYEYGLFGQASTCVLLAKTMQAQGKLFDNMVRSSIVDLAKKHNKAAQIRIMKVIYWDLDIIRAMLKRCDAHKILNQGEYNAYEMALYEDTYLCKKLSSVVKSNDIKISDIVKHKVFVSSPIDNINALFNM